MAKLQSNVLVIGVGGHAVAVDSFSGTELWRTKLKPSSLVTVYQREDKVFAGAGGELFCLDAASGQVLWQNKLKGLGLGLVAFPGTGDAAFEKSLQDRRNSAV
ncbi:MAG TPA: PQQ-binding-like beta-propeller repeat protein [Geothrix sp.]|nr:PQQ-binding-like beta-propeller repeat protein [Geothrix sp.]